MRAYAAETDSPKIVVMADMADTNTDIIDQKKVHSYIYRFFYVPSCISLIF